MPFIVVVVVGTTSSIFAFFVGLVGPETIPTSPCPHFIVGSGRWDENWKEWALNGICTLAYSNLFLTDEIRESWLCLAKVSES